MSGAGGCGFLYSELGEAQVVVHGDPYCEQTDRGTDMSEKIHWWAVNIRLAIFRVVCTEWP